MKIERVQQDMRYLYSKLSAREGKYVRNMNRYNNNGVRRESIWTMDTAPQAYVTPAMNVSGTQTQLNVCKSGIDTVTSRISQANVRPFFTPVNGSFDTTEACKAAQHFFDLWLDEQHAYPKSVMCFRDAATFDMGVMYVNPLTTSIQRLAPWEYLVDPSEYYHGEVSRAMVWKKYFPLAAIMGWEGIDTSKIKARFENDPFEKGEFVTYYDLYGGEAWLFYEDIQLREPIKLDFEKYGGLYRRPFVEIFYTKPVRGLYGVSLLDDLYPIQKQIDEIVRRMDDATRKSALQWVFIPKGSEVKASSLENGVSAYNFQPGPDGGAPVVMNPQPMNSQMIQLLQLYIDKAYEISGISQLSAQSKKPSGLDSGKALETMEDIESDRFNTQLQQFSHLLVDTTRVAIDCFPSGQSILPKDIGRGKLTWGNLRKQRDLFTVQFSAASSLSKDPEEKRNEIQFLLDQNIIDNASVKKFYQMPDLEGAYTLATSAEDYVDRIISEAIKNGTMEYAGTVDLMLLKSKALTKLNQLNAADDEQKYIDRLVELLNKILFDIKNVATLSNPQEAPPPPPPSQSALDAGQMKALSDLAVLVRNGMPVDSALAIAKVSFPSVDEQLLNAVIQGAVPPAPATALQAPPQGAVA